MSFTKHGSGKPSSDVATGFSYIAPIPISSANSEIIVSILFELCQLTGKVHGTFDMLDIGVYFIAVLIAYTIEKFVFRGNYYEKD